MALRIGKKKPDMAAPPPDAIAPDATVLDTNAPAMNSTAPMAPAPMAPAPDTFSGLAPNPSLPSDTPPQQAVLDDSTPKPRKKLPIGPLVALGALALAGAGGAYFFMNSQNAAQDTSAVVSQPTRPAVATRPPAPAKAPATKTTTTKTSSTTKKVAAGGPVLPKAVPSALQPKPARPPQRQQKTLRVPPLVTQRPQIAANIQADLGIAGLPGMRASRNSVTVVSVVPPAQSVDRTMLKQLWDEGAAAKRRGDTAGARLAWSKALKLASGNPALSDSARGFRGALDKLPG